MFDLDKYLADLILNCQAAFGERLLYMGLQGSWLRGEAHENSDIDIMVILDGVLIDYLPPATRKDEINYVKLSLGNLYHELCHRYIHADREKNNARFRGTCKSIFYLIQNLHFLESGHFILSRKDLKEAVTDEDRLILELAELPDVYDFDQAYKRAGEAGCILSKQRQIR